MKKIAAWLLLLFACIPALAWGGDDDWPSSSVFNRRSYFGYRFFVEGGYGMGMNIKTQPFGIGFQPALRYFDAGTTQGFQFGSLFYLGAGVSYLQLVGDAVEAEQPIRQITPYADLRFTFGSVFAADIASALAISVASSASSAVTAILMIRVLATTDRSSMPSTSS